MAEGKGERAEAAMLLGKRPRVPILRTTSMTNFSSDDLAAAADGGEGIRRHQKYHNRQRQRPPPSEGSPMIAQRRSCGDFGSMETTTAQFLMACGLCNRRLGPGSDTFIYRVLSHGRSFPSREGSPHIWQHLLTSQHPGEIAFCSLECRQHKMNQDELKDKCLSSKKTDAASSTTASETSGNGQTVVAA